MSTTSGYSLLNLFLWQTLCSRCLPFGCFGEINYVGTQHVTTTKKRALLCARSAAQGYNADSKTMEHNKKGFNCTQMKTAERQHFHFTDCSNCSMCLFLIWSMFKQVGKEKTKKGWKKYKKHKHHLLDNDSYLQTGSDDSIMIGFEICIPQRPSQREARVWLIDSYQRYNNMASRTFYTAAVCRHKSLHLQMSPFILSDGFLCCCCCIFLTGPRIVCNKLKAHVLTPYSVIIKAGPVCSHCTKVNINKLTSLLGNSGPCS